MSLRTRLLLVLAALAAAGLTVAAFATYASLESFLVRRVDRTTEASARALAVSLEQRGHPDRGSLEQIGSSTPGLFVGLKRADGEAEWLPIGTPPGEEPPPEPRLDRASDVSSDPNGATVTLGAADGGTHFRARLIPLSDGSTLVVAAPLSDVEETLHRLLLIELLVSLAVIGGMVGLGLWLVRVGLRPLERIESTAGAIAAGDLSRRIEEADERTEIGRLGIALNAMLAQIE